MDIYLQSVEEMIRHQFIPAITGDHRVNDDENHCCHCHQEWVASDLKDM